MPICKYCNEERPDSAFEICRVVNGVAYKRLRCNRCKRQTNNVRIDKLRRYLQAYKKTLCCERWGFSDHRALEFHHRDNSTKNANVADMSHSGFAISVIKREMDKCAVLCANCHDILHYTEWNPEETSDD